MIEALLISNIVLWIAVIALSLLVLALARQVGILHERVAPAGALQPTTGPKVGELTTALELKTLAGELVSIGGQGNTSLATLVLFISPTCPVCKSLVPTAKSLVQSEKSRLQLLFASDGADSDRELAQHKAYVRDPAISQHPYVISQQLGMTYEVSKLPFAVLIGADGILKSKGLVNTREHLESLVESMDSGIATLQDFIEREESQRTDKGKGMVRGFDSSTVEQST